MKSKKRETFTGKVQKFIFGNFKLSIDFIREIKNYLWFVLILFFSIGVLGYFFPVFFEERIINLLKEITTQTQGLEVLDLIKFIFINNLNASFFAMILGIFLGVVPFLVIVVNGYILGFVANNVVRTEGILVLWKLFPHGIFELPAVFISAAIGLKLGLFLIVSKKKGWEEFKTWLVDAFRVFVFVVIPLLVLAAIIEGILVIVLG